MRSRVSMKFQPKGHSRGANYTHRQRALNIHSCMPYAAAHIAPGATRPKRKTRMNPLDTIKGTLLSGLILSALLAVIVSQHTGLNVDVLVRWVHIAAGIAWIGLLYYFNFVQVPALA